MKTPTLDKSTKIDQKATDEMCSVCSQNYEGACRAYNIAHSDKEYKTRLNGYGMECDAPDLKLVRQRRGVKYHTLGD
mgnify:CR=1 FL=1